jgi:hypothetical protein
MSRPLSAQARSRSLLFLCSWGFNSAARGMLCSSRFAFDSAIATAVITIKLGRRWYRDGKMLLSPKTRTPLPNMQNYMALRSSAHIPTLQRVVSNCDDVGPDYDNSSRMSYPAECPSRSCLYTNSTCRELARSAIRVTLTKYLAPPARCHELVARVHARHCSAFAFYSLLIVHWWWVLDCNK